jgi:predicted ATPase
MLRELRLKNFRAFEDARVELSRINIILGPNNSGKSALISAVNLVAQTFEGDDPRVPLYLDGRRVDLGTYRDVVFDNDMDRSMEIGMTFDSSRRGGADDRIGFNASFSYMKRRKAIVVNGFNMFRTLAAGQQRFEFEASKGYPDCWIKGSLKKPKDDGKPFRYRATYRNFIPFPAPRKKDMVKKGGRYFIEDDIFGEIFSDAYSMESDLEGVEYLGPFREYPRRTFLFTGAIPSTAGVRGENAVRILADDILMRGKKKKNLAESVSRWFKGSEIAESVSVKIISPRHFEVKLKHPLTGELENLADVGFGCGQVLPILVSGYSVGKKGIFMVEQPELHLHPRAQAELGAFFYDLYRNEIQTIVETHSEHLILRIQYYLAKGLVKPSDIRVYYVYAPTDSQQHRKTIKEIRIDDKGRFVDEWPEGFFPEALEEARRINSARAYQQE